MMEVNASRQHRNPIDTEIAKATLLLATRYVLLRFRGLLMRAHREFRFEFASGDTCTCVLCRLHKHGTLI